MEYKNAWTTYDETELNALEGISSRYIKYLSKGKTERECVTLSVELAEKYGVSPATIVYAWLMQHPMGALPIVGGQSLARLDEAIAALDLHLERPDWYRVYAASGQQKIR